MSPSPSSRHINGVITLILVVGFGAVQFAYSSMSHPSTLLKVLEVIYGVIWLIMFALLARYAVQGVRRSRRGSVE
jgi:hypothetical protein